MRSGGFEVCGFEGRSSFTGVVRCNCWLALSSPVLCYPRCVTAVVKHA